VYKAILYITLILQLEQAFAQNKPRAPQIRTHPTEVNQEIIEMDQHVDSLSNQVLGPLINQLNICCRAEYNDAIANFYLDTLIKQDSIKIIKHISEIKRRFYPDSFVRDTSYFYYYANEELNNYLLSLDLLNKELKTLINWDDTTINTINEFDIFSSYNNLNQSRTLLFARMNNMQEKMIVDSLSPRVIRMDSLLNIPYRYVRSYDSKKDTLLKAYALRDKISTSTDYSVIQTKKNAVTWGILGGLIGGIVAGLLVHFLK
jgi:hypothetical protein